MTKQYRLLKALFYPIKPEILRRLKAGENLPMRERGMIHREAGSVVNDIPRESVPVLLEKGWIEEVTE